MSVRVEQEIPMIFFGDKKNPFRRFNGNYPQHPHIDFIILSDPITLQRDFATADIPITTKMLISKEKYTIHSLKVEGKTQVLSTIDKLKQPDVYPIPDFKTQRIVSLAELIEYQYQLDPIRDIANFAGDIDILIRAKLQSVLDQIERHNFQLVTAGKKLPVDQRKLNIFKPEKYVTEQALQVYQACLSQLIAPGFRNREDYQRLMTAIHQLLDNKTQLYRGHTFFSVSKDIEATTKLYQQILNQLNDVAFINRWQPQPMVGLKNKHV